MNYSRNSRLFFHFTSGSAKVKVTRAREKKKSLECCFDKQSFDLLTYLSQLSIFVIPESSVGRNRRKELNTL